MRGVAGVPARLPAVPMAIAGAWLLAVVAEATGRQLTPPDCALHPRARRVFQGLAAQHLEPEPGADGV